MKSTATYSAVKVSDSANQLKEILTDFQTIVIGAGAGLSTSAGFVYNRERFDRYFSDFASTYAFTDMYSGGFYPYDTQEEFWAYWSRYIWVNRYMDAPKPVYENLLRLIKDKDYFVITTNVDHCFQKAGFDKYRLFYTQGDYGLFQCSTPCHSKTYENEEMIRKMVLSQGWQITDRGELIAPVHEALKMRVPTDLIPVCPVCGKPLTMNLRSDHRFVEDSGWHQAAERYENFLQSRSERILFLELGVGYNTPGIIKYPFWQMTASNEAAFYICINQGDAVCPNEIKSRSMCINEDIGKVFTEHPLLF